MTLNVASTSIIMEATRTIGTAPYVTQKLGANAQFIDFYAPGDNVPYAADNGGSLAEFGVGTMLADGSIQRPTVTIWSSNGGVGGALVNWPSRGRRLIRGLVIGGGTLIIGGGGAAGLAPISGFWPGTIPADTTLQRFAFVDPADMPVDFAGSVAVANSPVATEDPDPVVDELGNPVVDETANPIVTLLSGGDPIVDELGNPIVDETATQLFTITSLIAGTPVTITISRNASPVGTMVFVPGSLAATLSLPTLQSFVAGDLLTLVSPSVSDANLSDITWTFKLQIPA